MMKNKKAIGASIATALALALCGGALVGCGDDEKKPEPLKDSALQATKIADFTTGEKSDREVVFESDGFENGDVFNTWWDKDNVAYDNNIAELSISEMTEKEQKWDEATEDFVDCQADYYGGEMRTSKYYGYGDYEVRMKPAKIAGTASTFFICTGPYDVNYETKEPNPHDEIDIEFLGYDTTFVQFNYFVDGVGGHEYRYKLGFDASKEYHTYGFRWAEDHIVWFVDGKPVYKVKASSKSPMPSTPGRIIANYWTGTEKSEGWMKEFKNDYSGKAQYEYFASSALALDDPTVAPPAPPAPPVEVPETGWTDIDCSNFGAWNAVYTMTATATTVNMSHTEAPGAYACDGLPLASDYSWVKFKIKNNSATEAAVVRLDVCKPNGGSSIGGVESLTSDYEGASHLAGDSAVLVELAAGDTAEVACKIKSDVTVGQITVFLNSTNDATAATGDITISELKGIIAEGGGEVDPPAPVELVEVAKIAVGDNVVFTGDGYTVTASEDKTSMTLAYADLLGNSYKNINGSIAEIIGDSSYITFKITNNGAANAKVRADIMCPKDAVYKDGTFCNLEAKYEGNIVSSGNDYQYGGADWVIIAPGETVTVTIEFKPGVGAEGIMFFVDSSTYNDEATHTGSVTISDMILKKVKSK